MFVNMFDSHTHSDNSPDGEHSVMFMCENAVLKNLLGISITDHCEINSYYQEKFDVRLRQSYFDIAKAKAAFGNRFVITAGIELGQPMHDPGRADHALRAFPFDFVLGSVHNIRGKEDFYLLDARREGLPVIYGWLDTYFQEILEMAQWGKFDVLAHLTYPFRYICGRDGVELDKSRFEGVIDEILKTLVQKSIGLEVNTSGYRQGMGGPFPDAPYIKRYRELGGELVTLGSDAHRGEDVGAGLEQGTQLLLDLGFTHFAVYKKREPRMLKLM